MQQICSKTGGGVGTASLDFLDGEGNMLVRPTQQPVGITTAKKQRKVGSFTILLCKNIHFANT